MLASSKGLPPMSHPDLRIQTRGATLALHGGWDGVDVGEPDIATPRC